VLSQCIVHASLVLFVLAVVSSGTPASATDPAVLYRAHCARCHGADARGNGPEAATLIHRPRDLREGFLQRYSVDDLVARVRSGLQLPIVFDPPALGRILDDVDAVTAHVRRIPTVDWTEARRGREIFLQRCEGCHGPTGEGARPEVPLDRVPPDLGSAEVRARLTGARRELAVRHALPGMLGVSQVPDERDGKALAAWVAVLSPGYRLYATYCTACHGEDGRPPAGLAEADRPKVVFDRAYVAEEPPSAIEESSLHMVATKQPRMPHLGGDLTEADTRAIIEYLRALP
jgi:mono/diheme cytochrome c family protein